MCCSCGRARRRRSASICPAARGWVWPGRKLSLTHLRARERASGHSPFPQFTPARAPRSLAQFLKTCAAGALFRPLATPKAAFLNDRRVLCVKEVLGQKRMRVVEEAEENLLRAISGAFHGQRTFSLSAPGWVLYKRARPPPKSFPSTYLCLRRKLRSTTGNSMTEMSFDAICCRHFFNYLGTSGTYFYTRERPFIRKYSLLIIVVTSKFLSLTSSQMCGIRSNLRNEIFDMVK